MDIRLQSGGVQVKSDSSVSVSTKGLLSLHADQRVQVDAGNAIYLHVRGSILVLDGETDLRSAKVKREGTGDASDIYKHQQYKQSLLKEDVLSNSDVIIKGEDLWDDKARRILTSDGSKVEDWAKMTSKQQYETPYGKGEIHFYQNQKTGDISPFDIKLKVSKPKKLRANENDLFWIIELDIDFNIKGVR